MEGRKRTLATVLKLVINENDKTERKGEEKERKRNKQTLVPISPSKKEYLTFHIFTTKLLGIFLTSTSCIYKMPYKGKLLSNMTLQEKYCPVFIVGYIKIKC